MWIWVFMKIWFISALAKYDPCEICQTGDFIYRDEVEKYFQVFFLYFDVIVSFVIVSFDFFNRQSMYGTILLLKVPL